MIWPFLLVPNYENWFTDDKTCISYDDSNINNYDDVKDYVVNDNSDCYSNDQEINDDKNDSDDNNGDSNVDLIMNAQITLHTYMEDF